MDNRNKEQHLNWCKERALQVLENGDTAGAFASFASDMAKHTETKDHIGLKMGLMLLATGNLSTYNDMKNHIEGYN